MLHEDGHHHVDQDELSRQHKRHKVQRGDELKPRVAAVVAPRSAGGAFPQCVLEGGGETSGLDTESTRGKTEGFRNVISFNGGILRIKNIFDLWLKSSVWQLDGNFL